MDASVHLPESRVDGHVEIGTVLDKVVDFTHNLELDILARRQRVSRGIQSGDVDGLGLGSVAHKELDVAGHRVAVFGHHIVETQKLGENELDVGVCGQRRGCQTDGRCDAEEFHNVVGCRSIVHQGRYMYK